jgi:hypothetical protein
LDGGEYAFQVFPGEANKLVIFFQGGGFCWDLLTHTMPGMCKKTAFPDLRNFGIFDRSHDANPFAKYTIINILYCSGDVHAGNIDRPWGPQRGMENVKAVLQWALSNFPLVESLVLSGTSGGSVGTQIWANRMLTDFKYKSAAVILDSFAAVIPEGVASAVVNDHFKMCETEVIRVNNPHLKSKCTQSDLEVQDLLLPTMASFPNVIFASIDSKWDSTQIMFWNALALTHGKQPIDPETFYIKLNMLHRKYDLTSNYVSYLVDGAMHCFLDESNFYVDKEGRMMTETTEHRDTTLPDWLRSVVTRDRPVVNICHGDLLGNETWRGASYCDVTQAIKTLPAIHP